MSGVDLFSIGRSGLNVAKKSLETTGHNISNANTEGYSRQRVTTKTGNPIREGNYVLGTGAEIQSIKRTHDEILESRLNKSITNANFLETRSNHLHQVEDIFNEVNSEGLNKIMNKFFNSFRELSNQPENESIKNIVRENARIIIKDMKRVKETLSFIEEGMNHKIRVATEDINSITKQVANLNKEIANLEATGRETGDLRDQRDLAVTELAKMFKTHTYINDKNHYVVSIEGVGAVVAGGQAVELMAAPYLEPGQSNQDNPKFEIYFKNRASAPVKFPKNFGQIGALFKTRDEEIDRLRGEMDQIAYSLSKAVNAIHRRGFKNTQFPEDKAGNPYYEGSLGQVTGINFFKEPTSIKGAVEQLQLSEEVASDLSNIATGMAPNTPGDNRIAIAVSKLQYEKMLENGTTSFEEKYLKSVGTVGLEASKTAIEKEQADGLLAQAKTLKEQNSGVSIDEEAANLIRYQHAYEASARVIKAAQETFDSLIRMMDA